MIRAFNYKVVTLQTDSAYNALPRAFPQFRADWCSLARLRSKISKLSGIYSEPYDCCKHSCHAFTGPYFELESCAFCDTARRDSAGHPIKQFHYLPLVNRLAAENRNPERAKLILYRSEHVQVPGEISDFCDSELYRNLLGKKVVINGKEYGHTYFSDPRDIALGISFDGFCPFKKRNQTCWPIIAFNYNLPPEIRFHQENIIPLGTIPGPKQMKDTNSFLVPLVEELEELARGVKVYDVLKDELFIMRAYVIIAFGDIPAAAKLMNMKGHNSLFPCRFCNIKGVRCVESGSRALYVPLYRPDGSYNPLELPLRTHDEFTRKAMAVTSAENAAEEGRLAKASGIKGISALSCLSSISFPHSFPPDIMHAFFENIFPQLLDLWTGDYKGMDQGVHEYELQPSVYKAICDAIVLSGDTIPAAYGCRVPNPNTDRGSFTAESWSIWGLMIGPVLLQNRFLDEQFYVHFIKLISLINLTLQLSITTDEVDQLKVGMAEWVTEFEE